MNSFTSQMWHIISFVSMTILSIVSTRMATLRSMSWPVNQLYSKLVFTWPNSADLFIIVRVNHHHEKQLVNFSFLFGAGTLYLYYISYINFETLLIVLIYVLQGLHVDKLTNEPVPISSSMPTFKGKEKPEKHPEKYKTCINFFQPLLKMLQNMIKRPGG